MANIQIRNIVVATDFFDKSNFAITRAIEIAKFTNATVTILHVNQPKFQDNIIDNILGKFLPKGLWLDTKEYNTSLLG